METSELLQEKIETVVRMVRHLQEKNHRLQEQCKKLLQEKELIESENRQARKLMVEIDQLREERKLIKKKCETLLELYGKAGL